MAYSLPAIVDPTAFERPDGAPWGAFGRARQVTFLEALAATGSVRAAAKAAGTSHQTAYRYRRTDAKFRRAWDGALLAARAQAEEVLACRALEGVEEQVFYHGELVATRRRHDSRLLLAHLARLDRLTQDADIAAFAEDFTDNLARFADGRDEADFSASGECNTRSKSNSPEDGEEDLAEPEDTPAEPLLDELLEAMEAARPPGARPPHEIYGYKSGEVEAWQIMAFEAEVER